MTDLLLTGAVLLAQAATCGTFGTPGSPGGCSLPAPGGGDYLLQTVPGGQLWVQPPIEAAPYSPSDTAEPGQPLPLFNP